MSETLDRIVFQGEVYQHAGLVASRHDDVIVVRAPAAARLHRSRHDGVIACILAMGDVREKRGGEHPPYLSSHVFADFLTALRDRGYEVKPCTNLCTVPGSDEVT